MDYQAVLDDIAATIQSDLGTAGSVADYIPALSRVDPFQFGMALRTRDGLEAWAGDALTPFSIQSISKVFSLTIAMRLAGERLWERIGREPSGNPFNSLMQLEREQGIPRNPFINAGAIVVADYLVTLDDDPESAILNYISGLCDEPLEIDEEVAASEAATGFRNIALANFIKSYGKLDNDVSTVLDVYFRQCAVSMNCVQLARAVNYLCRDGIHPLRDDRIISSRQARRINALMLTCGTYDTAGEFAFRIGVPCKSGVGGGIVAVIPDSLSMCVWSPALDAGHNSLPGQKALEMFTSRTGLSVF